MDLGHKSVHVTKAKKDRIIRVDEKISKTIENQ